MNWRGPWQDGLRVYAEAVLKGGEKQTAVATLAEVKKSRSAAAQAPGAMGH